MSLGFALLIVLLLASNFFARGCKDVHVGARNNAVFAAAVACSCERMMLTFVLTACESRYGMSCQMSSIRGCDAGLLEHKTAR